MIETTIAFIAFTIMTLIIAAKLWNIIKETNFYPSTLIIIGLIIGIFCWGIYFTSSMSALNQLQTITLDDGGIITQTTNNYQTLFNFFPIVNILIASIGLLSAIEGIITIKDIINPKQLRQQYSYTPRPPSQTYRPK